MKHFSESTIILYLAWVDFLSLQGKTRPVMLLGALLLLIGILMLAPAPFLSFLPQRLVLIEFRFNAHSCLKAAWFLEAPLRKMDRS